GDAVAAAGGGGQHRVPRALPRRAGRGGRAGPARRDAGGGGRGGPPVRAVGIVPHPQRAGAYAERAARFLADAGVEVRVPALDAEAIALPELAHDLATF